MSQNTILSKMLDRLFAGLASGPNLNCRPHSSRQRVDWSQFANLQDRNPAEALRQLLSDRTTQLLPRVTAPPKPGKPKGKKASGDIAGVNESATASESADTTEETLTPEARQHRSSWTSQQTLLTKLRALAEDARDYEQDTGVHVLHVGFPLLSLPPGVAGALKSSPGATKRLLAPIAFIPVSLEMRSGPQPVVGIAGLNDGADFLVPNEALFAWLERQTGQVIRPESSSTLPDASSDTSSDNEDRSTNPAAHDPWQEVNDLVARIAKILHLPSMTFSPESLTELRSAPRADDENSRAEIVPAAVLGLFPMNNQSLLRDMQEMTAAPEALTGPVKNFLRTNIELDDSLDESSTTDVDESLNIESETAAPPPEPTPVAPPLPEHVRLVTMADPCQSRAVRLARDCQGLVIHGPPGTGKSQTITNIIGDHLARGERVLLVCDKRTALDVVARRLEHLGLGHLCALIHDPQHDQRNLYMSVREQLEELTSTSVGIRAAAQVKSLERQWETTIAPLAQAWSLVMAPHPDHKVSLHERMGEWLESAGPYLASPTPVPQASKSRKTSSQGTSGTLSVELLETHASVVREAIARAAKSGFARQPWRGCIGMPLAAYLQRPQSEIQQELLSIIQQAKDVDAAPFNPLFPFDLSNNLEGRLSGDDAIGGFVHQAAERHKIAIQLQKCLASVSPVWRKRWSKATDATIALARQRISEAADARTTMASGSLDSALRMIVRASQPSVADLALQLGIVEAYLDICDAWYGWFAFGVRNKAAALLQTYGLKPGKESAVRLRSFLIGVNARSLIVTVLEDVTEEKKPEWKNFDDATLSQDLERLDLLIDLSSCSLLNDAQKFASPTQPGSWNDKVRQAMAKGDQEFAAALEASSRRAEALESLRSQMVESEIFHRDWLRDRFQRLCIGVSIVGDLQHLEKSLNALEEVLRIQSLLSQLPAPLAQAIVTAVETVDGVDEILNHVRYQVLTADIDQWLKSDPRLQGLDGNQLSNLHREVQRLEAERRVSTRDMILDLWTDRQRQRLLASTGSRLSSMGADLRRRLTTRGEKAMRLRQVVSVGGRIPDGDPLFDLRPVWMASPETVAQIFPREALFDVVIFDEASQCRLEEALPVLTRAKRVVIAGDPKQLPPTRFFETAVITSDNADVETEQELFEAHQSEVEDLLTAALSLDIQESHLDVHYRSRNADLVEFSNQQFYGSRLQAIPGHPRNRIRFAPITVYSANGVYEDRANAIEATQVCKIVADLLKRAEPPSIGIACFNLTQRDKILETLDEMATEDPDFAARLAVARSRIGAGAFEGLFVKNLENVQGDERDHMIISTTYGPDPQGRFYRRFGPLGQVGGGRRLNVLVTRAREEVHLVTSIPSVYYRNLPAVPDGQQPGGGWLLFAYLAYAEKLSQVYNDWRSDPTDGVTQTCVIQRPSRSPSRFAGKLAQLMETQQNVGSDVHWGNDGFCVDIAFHHPKFPEDRTLGLLCDGTRFQYADDPVAWDLFRTSILEDQGWHLTRCWTPQFFRDPQRYLKQFAQEANEIAETDPPPEEIPVTPE